LFSQQHRLDLADRVPPYEEGHEDRTAFLRWFKRWRPDALVASRADCVIDWLHGAGVRVRRDVGVVALRNERPELGHAGVHYDPAKVGALGVEMLVGLIHRHEIGAPAHPHEVLLPGDWCEGETLPARMPR